jgi:hypothetical protein
LDAEYGERGDSGQSSVQEPVSIEPYTSSVDTCRNLPTLARSAASSSTWVPSTLVVTNGVAPRMDLSTCDSAAKCTTASWPDISSPTSAASQMSPVTTRRRGLSATGVRLARLPEYVSLSSTVTSAPAWSG